MANAKMFRNSISGYNREDVNKYIKETDVAHAEETAALKSELEALGEKLGDALARIETLDSEKASLEGEIEALRAGEAEINAKLEGIRKEADFYKAESQAQLAVIATLKGEKADLASELDELKAACNSHGDALTDEELAAMDKESVEYKLGMYNKISAQLGDIIINANRTADEIVAKAKAKATELRTAAEREIAQKKTECSSEIARIKSETEEEAAYTRKRISTVAEDILSRASSELQGSIDSSVREVSTYVSDLQYEIKSLMTKISKRSDEMYDRIGYYQSCVSEGVDKRLSEMDRKYGIKKSDAEVE